MTVDSEFLDVSAAQLLQSMERIEACVAGLSRDQIWFRHSANENAVGNLLLHLRGNVTQWILSALSGDLHVRDRDAEFDAQSGLDGAQLVANLRTTVNYAAAVIRGLSAQRLLECIQPQGYDVTVLGAVYHVVEHFSGHTFQIIYAAKLLTGADLGFYAHLRRQAKPAVIP